MHYFCMKSNFIAQNCYSDPLNEGNALLLFINNLPLHSNQGLWVLHPYFSGRIIPLHAFGSYTFIFEDKFFLPARLFGHARLIFWYLFPPLHGYLGLHVY